MLAVISYDVVDDKNRTKLANILKDYGHRVQYSVFESDLEPDDFANMLERVSPLLNDKEDSLRIYRLCDACVKRTESLGICNRFDNEEPIVI